MRFNSFEFLFILLPAALFFYYLHRSPAYRNVVIIAASYVFYSWGQGWTLIFLIISSITDFYLGLALDRANSKHTKRLLLLASLTLNIGFLATLKYSAWLIGGVNHIGTSFGVDLGLPVPDLPLPPGISFYTFQSLSYIFDVYWGRFRAHDKVIDYMAYVAFFPHLVAGPIQRNSLLTQLATGRPTPHPRTIEAGIFFIVWGLTKKIVVADNLSNIVEVSYRNLDAPGAGLVLMYAFGLQIYADFSGYSDIARGSAKLFNVRLVRNFHTPYFSASPSEFWSRWHISLSTWIRDYIYIPLGGSRHSATRTVVNLMITMFLAGLWHGAGVTFIAWGLYHGLLLVIYHRFPIHQMLTRSLGTLGKVLSVLLFVHLVFFGWVIFWCNTENFLPVVKSAAAAFTSPASPVFKDLLMGVLIFSLPLLLADVVARRRNMDFSEFGRRLPWPAKAAVYVTCFYLIVFFGARVPYDFIYFQF